MFRQGQRRLLELVCSVVEDEVGVEAVALEVGLEVEVLGRGASRAPRESNHLSGLHLVANLHEVLRLVGVERFQAVVMAYDDAVAVAGVWRRACHDAVESGVNLVVGLRLDRKSTRLNSSH